MALAALESFDLERVRSALPETLQARIQSGRELLRRRSEIHRETPLATGLAQLDRLLGGGLERGALTEISGSRSSGRFSVALATLATATQGGEAAALVDLGGQLDPVAARDAGCDLERLLWAQAANLRQTLAAGEALLQAGFPLVVLDLGHPPVPGGRGQESAWTRLARAAEAQRAALLVSTPYRVSGTSAATVLAARARSAKWAGKGKEPRLLAGVRTVVTLQKARLQADEQRACVLEWSSV
jgi:RecA/RadA recombinase